MSKITFPYRIKNVFEGFAEAQGILTYDGQILNLEFQTQDALFGAIQSEIRNISIPKSEINEIDFKEHMFGCSLFIRVARMKSVEDIPKQEAGEVKLSIAKKNIDLALELMSQINLKS
jgi:hypothetical protein